MLSLRNLVIVMLVSFTAGMAAPAEEEPDAWTAQHFRLAQEAHRRNDLERACTEYRLIVSRHRKFAEAYLNLGIVYHQQRNYRAAVEVLATAASLKPDLQGAQLFLGIDRYLVQNFKGAIPPLTKALALNPSDRQAGVFLALAHLALEQPDDAARALRHTARHFPDDLEVLYHQGVSYLDAVRQSLAVLAGAGANSSMYHWALGLSAEQQNDLSAAVQEYFSALHADPAIAELYWRLAAVLRSGDLPELADLALARYRSLSADCQLPVAEPRALAAGSGLVQQKDALRKLWQELPGLPAHAAVPPVADAFVNRSIAALLLGPGSAQLKAVLNDFCRGEYQAAAGRIKSSTQPWSKGWLKDYLLARAYVLASDFDSAAAVFESRLQPYQDLPSVALLKVQVQSELALECFNKVVAKAPDSYLAHLLAAKSHAAAGKYDEAIQTYREVLKTSPDRLGVHLAIGQLHEEQLRLQDAIEEFRAELSLAPDNSLALAHLGHVYTEAREPDQAIAVLDHLLKMQPDDASALSDLGKAWAMKGETRKAIQAYEQALTYDEGLHGAHYRLFQLYKHLGDAARAQQHLAKFRAAEAKKQQAYQKSMALSGEALGVTAVSHN